MFVLSAFMYEWISIGRKNDKKREGKYGKVKKNQTICLPMYMLREPNVTLAYRIYIPYKRSTLINDSILFVFNCKLENFINFICNLY